MYHKRLIRRRIVPQKADLTALFSNCPAAFCISILHHNKSTALKHSTKRHSTEKHCTEKHNTERHSTEKHNTKKAQKSSNLLCFFNYILCTTYASTFYVLFIFYLYFSASTRATHTPEADACDSECVTPEPSPIAYMFGTLVMRFSSTLTLEL